MQPRPIQSKSAKCVITVGFLCADGLPLDRLAVGLEYFQSANQLSTESQYSVVLQSLEGGDITTSCGMRISTQPVGNPHLVFQNLLLFGGHGMVPEYLHRLARVTRTHLRTGAVVLATENAVFPVAETGLLKGLIASVAPHLRNAFQEQFPDVDVSFGDNCADGRIWSAGEGFSMVSLLSRMVSRHVSPTTLSALNRRFHSYRPTLSCG
jgi:transcriptional regulator GlxA family with amidase domain